MILTEIQGHIRTAERVSLAQLSASFGISPGALRSMLDRLVAKGRIRRLESAGRCSGCMICPPEALEFYEWAAAPPTLPPPTCATAPEQRRACRHCG